MKSHINIYFMCAYFVLNKMGVVQDPTRFLLC